MKLRFHYDADTGLPHIANHGVTEEEVEQVLRSRGDDTPARGISRMKVGKTNAGRLLQVIYVPDKVGSGRFIVSAYDLPEKQKRAFRRRRRRGKS